MAPIAALRQEVSRRNRAKKLHPRKRFDRSRLVQELLSLGNPKITLAIASTIGDEIASELKKHPRISAELVSEKVAFKLKERGLFTEKSSEDEETVSIRENTEVLKPQESNRTQGLLQRQKPTLPTLEKFLRPVETQEAENTPLPQPPRAKLQVSPQALLEMCRRNPQYTSSEAAREHLATVMEEIAQVAASAEIKFKTDHQVETVAVAFYNAMANQEFYPHLPALLGNESSLAYGGHALWVDLPLGAASQDQALAEAQKIWQQGGCALFALDRPQERGSFIPETFERFLQEVEKAILELPESVAIPSLVGLHLRLDHPEIETLLSVALSGKYYPKFGFSLTIPDGQENHPLLPKLWARGTIQFIFEKNFRPATKALDEAQALPRWGGGPDLLPFEACQLGSLNLAILAAGQEVDWIKLRRMVHNAVHLLDNLFEVSEYPIQAVAQQSRAYRKLGLGVMGFAELVAKLGHAYDSEATVVLAEKIMRFIHHESHKASLDLAHQRGVFPRYTPAHGDPTRNGMLNSVVCAPWLSQLAGVTPGIQPFESMLEGHSDWQGPTAALQPLSLLKSLSMRHQAWTEALETEILAKGSVRQTAAAPKALGRLFPTRAEVLPEWKLKIQSAFQRHCEGGLGARLEVFDSKTNKPSLNTLLSFAKDLGLPYLQLEQNLLLEPDAFAVESSQEEVTEVARPEVLSKPVQEASETTETSEDFTPTPSPTLRERPEVLEAKTHQILTDYGPMTFTVGYDQAGPFELVARLGKAGSPESAQAEALSRLATLLFRVGGQPQWIYEELRGITNRPPKHQEGKNGLSIADAMAQGLDQEFGYSNEVEEEETEH